MFVLSKKLNHINTGITKFRSFKLLHNKTFLPKLASQNVNIMKLPGHTVSNSSRLVTNVCLLSDGKMKAGRAVR